MDSVEYFSGIDFKPTSHETGLTSELFMRYVHICIALLECDYSTLKKQAHKTSNIVEHKQKLVDVKIEIESMKNIFQGMRV